MSEPEAGEGEKENRSQNQDIKDEYDMSIFKAHPLLDGSLLFCEKCKLEVSSTSGPCPKCESNKNLRLFRINSNHHVSRYSLDAWESSKSWKVYYMGMNDILGDTFFLQDPTSGISSFCIVLHLYYSNKETGDDYEFLRCMLHDHSIYPCEHTIALETFWDRLNSKPHPKNPREYRLKPIPAKNSSHPTPPFELTEKFQVANQ